MRNLQVAMTAVAAATVYAMHQYKVHIIICCLLYGGMEGRGGSTATLHSLLLHIF